jgi:hypothetical protein
MNQALYAHINNKRKRKKKRKNPTQKRAGGVAQVVGLEFKRLYCEKNKKRKKKKKEKEKVLAH